MAGVAAALLAAAAAGFVLVRRRRKRRSALAMMEQGEGGKDGSNGTAAAAAVPLPGSGGKPGSGRSNVGANGGLPAVLVSSTQRPLMAWHGGPPSEAGSVHSSPNSQLPLLGQGGAANGSLFKFPSGISGVSSHDNPMFDPGAGTGGYAGSIDLMPLPQRVNVGAPGAWGSTVHAAAGGAVVDSNGLAVMTPDGAPGGDNGARGSGGPPSSESPAFTPEMLRFLERKAATAPCRLDPARRWPQRAATADAEAARSGSAADGGSDGGGSRPGSPSTLDASRGGLLAWQLRRSKSWDGVLQLSG